MVNVEKARLMEATQARAPWRLWGPYLSERQWGTVREDYSVNGDAWRYFPHEHARFRAYRAGEDGIAGWSDDRSNLCFALALWNGRDPILKERFFGLGNHEGNHGEDVKEYYFYLDGTPTHSYMKMLYKYPQSAFPYAELVATNQQRNRHQFEYELLDTGVFEGNRYFDVFVEYAKATPEDILIRITVENPGPKPERLHLLPTLWFRNTWSQPNHSSQPQLEKLEFGEPERDKPELRCVSDNCIEAHHAELGAYALRWQGSHRCLFTENETNYRKLRGTENRAPFVKDGIGQYLIHGAATVNPERRGTKASVHCDVEIPSGAQCVLRLRLSKTSEPGVEASFNDFDQIVELRKREADAFYSSLMSESLSPADQSIVRQALAGMLWSKQYYEYDVGAWVRERPAGLTKARNHEWTHMRNADVISMPDTWEYPWYATWDLAFHAIALVFVDPSFAKDQLLLFLSERYQHPTGQLPAYDWDFCDVNPPTPPFAVMSVYHFEQVVHRCPKDREFLSKAFVGLDRNFRWWTEAKDPGGKSLFEGGFLGLDNIGVFDRSSPLPTGGRLEQSDATAWMALFAQHMLRIALELSESDPSYEDQAIYYLERFAAIASTISSSLDGQPTGEFWDDEDGFFYDVLRFPDGSRTRLKVQSLVGLLPLCAVSVVEHKMLERLPRFRECFEQLMQRHPDDRRFVNCPKRQGLAGRHLLSLMDETKLRRVLQHMLAEQKFLSPHGIRSLSKIHHKSPYEFHWDGVVHRVAYVPGESDSPMFGGNSNWRGPVWLPMNFLILRSLLHLYTYYGDSFQVEYPTGSGKQSTLFDVARGISERLIAIFRQDARGNRPLYGGTERFQTDPRWRDYLLFFEYFHGDDGAGLGASHQTGWTGLIAPMLLLLHELQPQHLATMGIRASSILEASTL